MDSPNRYTEKDNVIAPLKQTTESQHHIINLLRQSLPSIPPWPIVEWAAWFTVYFGSSD